MLDQIRDASGIIGTVLISQLYRLRSHLQDHHDHHVQRYRPRNARRARSPARHLRPTSTYVFPRLGVG